MSLYSDIWNAHKAAIEAMALPGITDVVPKHVYNRKFPWIRDDVSLPAVIISPVPEKIRNAVHNARDIGYGFQISICHVSNNLLADMNDALTAARQLIIESYEGKRIPGSSLAYFTEVEFGFVFEPESFRNQIDASSFIFRTWTRRVRTN